MQIRVDLDKPVARGIAVTDMVAAIRDENTDVTAGTIDLLRTADKRACSGSSDDASGKVADTVIAHTEANQPIYVHYVAEGSFAYSKGDDVRLIAPSP